MWAERSIKLALGVFAVGVLTVPAYAACLSGLKEAAGFVSPSPACLQTFDFDPTDGDVDAADFAGFQRVFEGS